MFHKIRRLFTIAYDENVGVDAHLGPAADMPGSGLWRRKDAPPAIQSGVSMPESDGQAHSKGINRPIMAA